MKIGIDISLLCLKRPTGVPLIARYMTETLVREFPEDTFILFGCVPRESKQLITQLPMVRQPNVYLKLIGLPQRIFTLVMPLWQKIQWPSVELFVGHLDIFHNFDWYMLPANAPMSATMYDLTPLTNPKWHTRENSAVFTKRLRVVVKKCAHVFAISKHTKSELLHFFPNLSNRLSVVYPDAVLHTNTTKTARVKPGYLFVVGTVEPRKNLVRVLKAYLELSAVSKIPPLVVAGSVGWDEEALKLLKSNKQIIPVGYVSNEQLSWWYKNALALVYPSLAEGFGIPILEAMRSGTMVITSNVTSMPEVGGEAAWYCNPLSIESIKQAMIRVVTASKTERQKRIASGYIQAKLFSYAHSAALMHTAWESLVRRGV